MTDGPDDVPPDLKALRTKIARARGKDEGASAKNDGYAAGMQMAVRMLAEVIAGVVAGSVLGYLLDDWLGTFPLLFFIGFLLGCGASGRSLYRLASREESGMNKRK